MIANFTESLPLSLSRFLLQSEKERCLAEIKELKQRNQCLQNQLQPLTKQREYQEKEIQRLNKVSHGVSLCPSD